MSTTRPQVIADPAQRFGQPAVRGISVDRLAELAWAESVDAAITDYDLAGMTRPDVLVACWYTAWYGSKRWRKRWRAWANDHVQHMAAERWDQIPDPPGDPS